MEYETGIIQWVEQQVALIQDHRCSKVDWPKLSAAIKDLGKRGRDRVFFATCLLIQDVLKRQSQPEQRSRPWAITIPQERDHLQRYLPAPLSLKRYWAGLSKVS